MRDHSTEFLPEARTKELVIKEVDGELLIYDHARDRAHCLNGSAAAIWRRCDGRTGVREITQSVNDLLRTAVGEDLILMALKQLNANHLLTEGYEVLSSSRDLCRRTVVRKFGLSLALLPLITSISAPTALAAISCSGPCSGGPGRGTCSPGCVCSGITGTCVVA